MACNGMLAGLVAITAPCAFVSPNSAVIIGIIAGILVCVGVLFNERKIKVDDPCGAISVHGYCGWWGAVSVGIFADGTYGSGWNGVGATTYLGTAGQGVTGLLYGDVTQFLTQIGGATLIALYAFCLTYVVFKVVNRIVPLRVPKEVELEGLDVPEFGMPAYSRGQGRRMSHRIEHCRVPVWYFSQDGNQIAYLDRALFEERQDNGFALAGPNSSSHIDCSGFCAGQDRCGALQSRMNHRTLQKGNKDEKS